MTWVDEKLVDRLDLAQGYAYRRLRRGNGNFVAGSA